jgi:hypothetical protein
VREKLTQQIAILISNTVIVVCFALLAVAFNHWWIVLFSALFLTYTKSENKRE